MPNKWIVVANRIHARIFREHPFALIETVKNELGREKNRALTNDNPGIDNDASPHEDAAVQFARQLDRHLQHGFGTNRFDKLLILAEPKMMGRIRESLARPLAQHSEWLGKDYAHYSTEQIAEALGLSLT